MALQGPRAQQALKVPLVRSAQQALKVPLVRSAQLALRVLLRLLLARQALLAQMA
jgi:hypothetical protein